ncbi:MAG: succinylglutamate desuccinylase/aspartoacylase family protein [Bacteroidales bacterium]|nr:succinylglutamate desuccinylase/aspartoacylase family protein [Bacteroidales bacterium]
MIILDTKIKSGKSYVLNMDIARLHTHTKIELPVIIERAKKDGPTILFTAGIHGDEINGVEIVRQIITKKYNKPEIGTVICLPLLNVFGFLNKTREFPDGRDLNRMFPGTKTGSLASRFAYFLMNEIVPHIDYCVDFHTGGAERFNYTQLRINNDDPELLELATVFGAKFIKYAQTRDNSFRQSASKIGKHVILFEGGKSLYLSKTVTENGVQGAVRVMHHLEMRDFSDEIKTFPIVEKPIIIKSSSWIRARHSGIFRLYANIGSYVKNGEVLGSISDPFGSFEREVKATHNGYVISSNHSPLVNQGDALVNLTN